MPRAPKQPPTHKSQPYSRPSSSSIKIEEQKPLVDMKPVISKQHEITSGKSKGRPWTAAEYLALFDIVDIPAPNAKVFEGRIEGRSGYQCQQTWRNTVLPYLRKALQEKPGTK